MLACGVLTTAGALVRSIPTFIGVPSWSVYLLHAGQCLNGISGAMVASTASAISATYAEKEKSLLYSSNSIRCTSVLVY